MSHLIFSVVNRFYLKQMYVQEFRAVMDLIKV